jgi:hypothetical protein
MQDQIEIAKINAFLSLVSPIIVEVVRTSLRLAGCEVQQEGQGFDLAFSIKLGDKEAKFFLHNLLLEIATIDRDEEPLRFDENLRDFDFFAAKTARLVESKLNVLSHLFGQENVDAAIENISQNAAQYERIRIWRFDRKPR